MSSEAQNHDENDLAKQSELRRSAEIMRQGREVAVQAAIAASREVLRYWPNPLNQAFEPGLALGLAEKSEGTGNYATVADSASERIIITAIKANPLLAEHHINAEESGIIAGSEWQWELDGIDGTIVFTNGLPDFGISAGLRRGQESMAGVIAMPAMGQLIVASKGEGAQLQDFEGNVLADLEEKTFPRIDHALVAYDLGYVERGRQLNDRVAKIADKIAYPVSYASSSKGNFAVAMGQVAAYFCETPTRFDIGAASAIIPEVGGIVTDMSGNPIDWNADQRSYLASRDPRIHQQLLDILNS